VLKSRPPDSRCSIMWMPVKALSTQRGGGAPLAVEVFSASLIMTVYQIPRGYYPARRELIS